jgi:drug/metabolite transporter (DMT)-like permease
MPETSPSTENQSGRVQADLALLIVSIIWGSAFVAQRIAAPNSSPFIFNGLRFSLAALVLLPVLWVRVHQNHNPLHLKRTSLIGMVVAGLLLTSGAALQQAGLRYTTAGNAGFITGLYVVIIPIIQAVAMKQSIHPAIWVAALLAAVGLFLLSTGGQLTLKIGDVLELAGALFWALHVIWIGQQARLIDSLQLAAGQYLVCGIASIGLGLIIEPGEIFNNLRAGWAILYTGIISVGLGYTLQIYGQKAAPPADAAILLSLEAVFAAIFGWFFLNEALSTTQIFGCSVMLAGMLLAQASSLHRRATLLRET